MQGISSKNSKGFSGGKISTDQAIKILKRNGLDVTYEQAMSILDFLYLIAKTTTRSELQKISERETIGEIEPDHL